MSRIQAAALAALLLPAAAEAQELPVVKLFTTGGTIQSLGKDRLKLAEYREGRIDGADDRRSGARGFASRAHRGAGHLGGQQHPDGRRAGVAARPPARGPSSERPEVAGAIVTHGTTTLEETAYFLHLTVRTTKPVVVIGSMRPWTAVSRDGPLNFLGAVRTVLTPEAAGKGVLVLLNDTIHSARFVTKRHTYHIETFVSPDVGSPRFRRRRPGGRSTARRSPATPPTPSSTSTGSRNSPRWTSSTGIRRPPARPSTRW